MGPAAVPTAAIAAVNPMFGSSCPSCNPLLPHPLLAAIYNETWTDDDIINTILPTYAGDQALMNKALPEACSYQRSDLAVSIVDNTHVDLKSFDFLGYTPLHIAAWKGLPKVIEAILRKGVDADILTYSDNRTETPLDCYLQKGVRTSQTDLEVTNLLLHAGANGKAREDA